MARLPGPMDLSPVASMRSGRAIASYDTSGLARGVQQAGAALQGLGADLRAEEDKRRQQRNVVEVANAEAHKTEGLLRVQNDFDYDPDFATYTKRAPEATGQVVDESANLITDPEMRERWKAQARTDAVRTNDGIFDGGKVRERQALVARLTESADANFKIYTDPNVDEATRAKARADNVGLLDMAERSGLVDPQQALKARKDFLEGGDLQLGLLMVEQNPGVVLGQKTARFDATPPASVADVNPANVEAYIRQAARARGIDEETAVNVAKSEGLAPGVWQSTETYNGARERSFGPFQLFMDGGLGNKFQQEYGKSPEDPSTVYDQIDFALDEAAKGGWGPWHGAKRVGIGSRDGLAGAKPIGRSGTVERRPASLPIISSERRGYKPDLSNVKPELLDRFKALQDTFGSSIPVVSGFRDQARNQRAGGASKSRHIEGDALDLDVSDMSQQERIKLIQTASAMGFTGIGVYDNSLHIDTGNRRAWGPSHGSSSVPAWAQSTISAHLANQFEGKAGAYSGMPSAKSMPDWYQRLSPADRQRVINAAEAKQKEIDTQTRAQIEIATTNAPVAIQNTGAYTGQMPTPEQFFAAYGPAEGAQRYNTFQAAVETGKQAYDMRTMSASEIEQMVAGAAPTSSGDDAALETQRYEALTKAATATLKARNADPATYTQQTFPAVKQAWEAAEADPQMVQAALAATAQAQQMLGIQNMQLMPKTVAENAVNRFKDETTPAAERIGAVTSMVFATGDPAQRRAIFKQLVNEGLPEIAEGALQAVGRGDDGAARRLFEAAMTDPSKLPGESPQTPAAINEKIQDKLFAENALGDVYYGLSDGGAENVLKAQRDAKLLNNAVELRLRRGEDLQSAIDGASRDLFGDVEVLKGDGRAAAELIVPRGTDGDLMLNGLGKLLPRVDEALRSRLTVPADIAGEGKAVTQAVMDNYASRVMAEGYFRNNGDGYSFFDPFVGAPVAGPDGNPLIFTPEEVEQAGSIELAPIQAPTNEPLTDDAFDAFQRRMQNQ